jgi:4-diphosphocytidyl-2-C-methyl-D-erythritol kinase
MMAVAANETATLFAPAKINLALHVIGRRADGYHDIDTLVAFANVGDWLRARLRSDTRIVLESDGPFAGEMPSDPLDNLVVRAARRLQSRLAAGGIETAGANLRLTKNLPAASGIGGGSADAAAALLALSRVWRVDPELDLKPLAGEIGADVAMCLESRILRARGVGDRIDVLPDARFEAVMVNPGVAVATADVFSRLAVRQNPPLPGFIDIDIAALSTMRNDLEAPARATAPVIGEVLDGLGGVAGCRLARMSGSGASCFGLFDTREAARLAAQTFATARPQWWVRAVTLGSGRDWLAGQPAMEQPQ